MNHDVYMQGQMRLGAWILFHLKNQDIPGLQYASNSESHHSEIIFQFPWIKMGEHNWEDAWSIIKVSRFSLRFYIEFNPLFA